MAFMKVCYFGRFFQVQEDRSFPFAPVKFINKVLSIPFLGIAEPTDRHEPPRTAEQRAQNFE